MHSWDLEGCISKLPLSRQKINMVGETHGSLSLCCEDVAREGWQRQKDRLGGTMQLRK